MMKGYPKEIVLRDGTPVTLGPLEAGDGPALLEMFQRLPRGDRVYLRDDVTDKSLIDRWVKSIDLDKVFPLIAKSGKKIVGDATLHRSRIGASRHLGEIRIVIDPEFRQKGLGTIMIREIVVMASRFGLERLVAEFVSEEEAAIKAFQKLGFEKVAVLPETFKTENGVSCDKVIMTYSLVTDWDVF